MAELKENKFILSKKTRIEIEGKGTMSIKKAVEMLKRDINSVIESEGNQWKENSIKVSLVNNQILQPEIFHITFSDCGEIMQIQAKDDLGAIYGLLYISEKYLGVTPFWFWNDQKLNQYKLVEIPTEQYTSKPHKVRFRGWFVNDEVLLLGWKDCPNDKEVWEPVLEALLRCGGNMVVPGTDKNSRINKKLASDMGLWVTHHHAEPLGAEMFLRKYPDKEASYRKNPELFEELWREAIEEQKDMKIIWNLGFRGQGDRAFWEDDPTYKDSASRGKLISEIMCKQYELVHKYVDNPVCCTNLYGEIMELYREGHIETLENVIKVWADSGYGKMVSRRQENHNPRVPALPNNQDTGPHGIYYHITFYDLQASNHLTMLPNSPDFVAEELHHAFDCKADEFLIVNSGNIRPHTYMLDLVSDIWKEGEVSVSKHLRSFIEKQYTSNVEDICNIYQEYFESTLQYGQHLDEKAGEQYYHYSARRIVNHWLKGEANEIENKLIWATGKIEFASQVNWLLEKTLLVKEKWEQLYRKALEVSAKLSEGEKQRFADSILLQIILHNTGCKGLINVCESYRAYCTKDYAHSFMLVSEGKKQFEEGFTAMKQSEHDKWEDYYRNDCLTNVELTVYCLDTLRRYIRVLGDGPSFYEWEKLYLYPESEKNVVLITNFKKPLTDDELGDSLNDL